MWHRKFDKEDNLVEGCGGRVFVDRAYSNNDWIETACIECGKRWILDADKNLFAKMLVKSENRFLNAGNR